MALHSLRFFLVLPHSFCLGRKIYLQVNDMKFSLLISPIDFAWGNSKTQKPFSLYLPKIAGVHIYLSYKKIKLYNRTKNINPEGSSTLILIHCCENKLPLSLNQSELSWRK